MKLLVRIAATGCRNQPGEKSENKFAGKPMPAVAKETYYGNGSSTTAGPKWIQRPALSS